MCVIAQSCGPAVRPASEEVVVLPSYTPAESALFDDQFDEAVFGRVGWSPDHKLRDRVRLADTVAVAKVVTSSEQATGASAASVVVELATQGQVLAGAPANETVRLNLAPSSPSYHLFRGQRPKLLGKDVVLFYRRYLQGGEERVHFRAEPNISAVHMAIQQVLSTSTPAP